MEPTDKADLVSVVLPVVEGKGDPVGTFSEIADELEKAGERFEFIFIVDGKDNPVLPELRRIKGQKGDLVTVVVFSRSFGESTAFMAGFGRCQGDIVVALTPDPQVELSGIAPAIGVLKREEIDVAVGRRVPRKDSLFNRAQSAVFHWIVRKLTATEFHDISCGVWVMRRNVVEELTLYGDLYRFIPILALNLGFSVCEVNFGHRLERRRFQVFTVGAYFRRIVDALTIFFLVRFTRKPLRLFGTVGLLLSALGGAISLYLGAFRLMGLGKIGDRPLLLLGILLIVLGVQSLSIGLLGEIIILTHARKVLEYRVAEVI